MIIVQLDRKGSTFADNRCQIVLRPTLEEINFFFNSVLSPRKKDSTKLLGISFLEIFLASAKNKGASYFENIYL